MAKEVVVSDSQQFELERYFDGLMDEQEQALFLSDSNNRQLLDQAKDLHDDIDDSLRRSFKFSPIGVDSIVTSLQKVNVAEDDATSNLNETTKKNGITRTALIRFAIAATLLVSASVLFWMFSGDRTVTPFFEPRPVAAIYSETVERGFKPYYRCEDEQRFANTFRSRQGVALALSEMPSDRRMLGLSHLGGISRTTTAMLCEANGERVLVFVDTQANDEEANKSVDIDGLSGDLNVFVKSKNGLVFYEVTPLDSPKMLDHFEFVQ